VPFGFGGAVLGMTLPAWQASSASASASPCEPPAGAPGKLEMCRAAGAPIGGGRLARDLKFTFRDGHLTEIEFDTSIDGFSDTTARLNKAFGPPSQIVRDTITAPDGVHLPHVRMRWRSGRSTIVLDDPTPAHLRLSVQMSLSPDPDRPGASGHPIPGGSAKT
jgi:hypothetical protein